ncbi:unnamed protein product [Orchesella dallaii]|uniref:Uncharacterized protein n=1 Tax=Orchesella dallaii TaxID=48710 RepID=A0ABP1PI84_9HEXA
MMAHKVIPLATTEQQQFEIGFEPFVTIENLYVEPPSSTASAVFTNNGTSGELPPDMQFNDGHRLAITVYSLLMFFSAAGNIYVLTSIANNKNQSTVQRSERLNRCCKDVTKESPYKSTSQKAHVDVPKTQDAVVVVHSKGQCITGQADLTYSNGRFPVIIFQGQETQV